MAIEDMIKRIMDEAKEENQKIILDARKETDSIKAESRSEIDKQISEMEKGLKREITNIRNIYISDGKRKARQALLSSKEELIWDTICAIRDCMRELKDERLGSYLQPMLSRSKKMLGDRIQVYPIRPKDAKVLGSDPAIIGLVSNNLGYEGPLSRYQGTDLLGGFIAITPDGERVVDMSFHGILERNEERIREAIARTLFGDQ